MTADSYLVLRCDGDDCHAETHWPVRFTPHTHRELRRLVKQRDGWRFTRDGRDLCAEHATEKPTAAGEHQPPAA